MYTQLLFYTICSEGYYTIVQKTVFLKQIFAV